ncbi:glycoside hydrolase family 43 protein [Falsiroseomonas oryzae]|uniref:glycoside hydrolase family 43 protein n=1 Tax=Falsiroseomonas oryzae TaxID=2766473 RepID=UPI0022EA7267|nr:family 43 glycosylhydrolase [Roseomonas sp. MO-31]
MARFVETTYANPLIEEPWADPAVAGPDDEGWYWCYATDDEHEPEPPRRFKVARSRDLVRWQTHPPGAEAGAIAAPIPNATRFRACWAPDVRRLGPRDWVFYGSLKFDDHAEAGEAGHGIFVARASTPTGFGDPVVLARGRAFTTIDPCFFRSSRSGGQVLYWGSGHGPIRGRELRADGMAFAPGSVPQDVLAPDPANPDEHLWEGAHVIERPGDGAPLMLVSGVCTWSGPYRVHVFEGGSDPLDRFRRPAGGSLLLRENATWNRCGQVFVVQDAIGQHWIFYHAVRGEALIPGTEDVIGTGGRRGIPLRQLCLDPLQFGTDGMPFVEDGSPSAGLRPGPVVRVA